MEHPGGQCCKPGAFWGHVPSSGGGAGSGMASRVTEPWGVTVLAALGRGAEWPALDGFPDTLPQHLPHSGHHQPWWQLPSSSFSPHLLFFTIVEAQPFPGFLNPHISTFLGLLGLWFSAQCWGVDHFGPVCSWGALSSCPGTITLCHLESEHRALARCPPPALGWEVSGHITGLYGHVLTGRGLESFQDFPFSIGKLVSVPGPLLKPSREIVLVPNAVVSLILSHWWTGLGETKWLISPVDRYVFRYNKTCLFYKIRTWMCTGII